jgi:hypothetical protein
MTGSGFGFVTKDDDFVINGGTISIADFIKFNGTNATYTFGVGSGGSVTADRFDGTRTAGDLNWLTGSQMSVTLSGENEWAEASWNAGYLTYNGDDFNTLGTRAAVTAAGGLDGTYSFAYDSLTETLSLAGVVPEPSAFALLAGMTGLAFVALRRRR